MSSAFSGAGRCVKEPGSAAEGCSPTRGLRDTLRIVNVLNVMIGSAILIGTLASVATVTGLLWLISNDLLPVSLLPR